MSFNINIYTQITVKLHLEKFIVYSKKTAKFKFDVRIVFIVYIFIVSEKGIHFFDKVLQ